MADLTNDMAAAAGGLALHNSLTQPSATTDTQEQHMVEKTGQIELEVHNSDDSSQDDNPKESPPKSNSDRPRRSKGKIALIMLALALANFLVALDVTIVTTALPTITQHFQSETVYTWVGSSYLLGVASTTIVWGKLSDVFGRKPALLLANFVFFVGSLIAALSVNVTMLLFARSIQGLGGAGLSTLVNVCIGDMFSPRERGAFYGVLGVVWAVALSLGPIVGGLLTERVTWRWCFYINLPLDGLAFIILLFFLDLKTPRTPFFEGIKTIDWVGAALSIGGTLMLLFGLCFGGERNPWNSPIVICLIVFGIVTWVLFLLYESYIAKYPLMPVDLFKTRAPLALLGLSALQACVYFSAAYYLPLYFQAVLGASPILSGVYLLPIGIALSVTSIGAGLYMRKTGNFRPPIFLGFIFMTLGFGLFIDLGPTANWALIILAQVVAGAGCGPNFQAPMITLQSLCPPRSIASATSCLVFVRMLGGSMSIVIGQVVFQNEVSKRQARLVAAVGADLAAQIGGGAAGAHTALIKSLPLAQRQVVHEILAESLRFIWIVYTALSVAALVIMLLIGKSTLTNDHEETKTGLEAEREARQERMDREKARREARVAVKSEA